MGGAGWTSQGDFNDAVDFSGIYPCATVPQYRGLGVEPLLDTSAEGKNVQYR